VKKLLLCILFLASYFLLPLKAQTVYEHISSTGIYLYLDEMANEKIIKLNTAIKPYSRHLIAQKLKEISQQKEKLNKRQTADLNLYLHEFYLELQTDSLGQSLQAKPVKPFRQKQGHTLSLLPPAYSFGSKDFNLSFRPLGGGEGYVNKQGNIYNSYWGGNLFMYGFKSLGIYANYRDAHQSKEVLAYNTYLTQNMGANYKEVIGRTGADYSEMRGGITLTHKWFSIGLVKDHTAWGNNYNGSNIFSGRTPSFAMLKMQAKPTKWFELNYYHGWLISEVVDSARSYNPGTGYPRTVFRNKYIAANFITIGPIKGVALSLGNSIVYSDINIQPAYLIPFLYYKPVDHAINHGIDNQNSQIYFDLSIRTIKHLHLYGTLYIDEFSITRIADKNRYNFYSYKAGFKVNNWPLKNIFYTFEYTQSSPIAYQHRVPTLTFESNRVNMGHYLRDNSKEYYANIGYKPLKGLSLSLNYTLALKGIEHPYIEGPGTISADTYPLIDTLAWKNQQIGLNIAWEFSYNCRIDLNYTYSNITAQNTTNQTAEYYLQRFTPAFFRGKNNTLMLGLHFGF
jgi:hypothetical protein